jgi:acyl-CoA thioester hydrolase
MGHMNVMWYTGKFDEASWSMLARLGLTQERLNASHRGMAAVQQNITYKRELRAGDVLTISTTLLEVREKSIRCLHEMTKDASGETAAIAEVTGVHIDTRIRRSIELPVEIRRRASDLILGRDVVVEDLNITDAVEQPHQSVPGIFGSASM